MSRRLILMRHAKQTGLAVRDHDRPLTDGGRDDAYGVGERLACAGAIPDRVLSSTALRCQQTWEAVASGLGSAIEIDLDLALYNASSHDLLHALLAVDDDVQSLLLLAHNPGISMLGRELSTARESDLDVLRAGFAPATTAHFEIDGTWSTISARTARLVRFTSVART